MFMATLDLVTGRVCFTVLCKISFLDLAQNQFWGLIFAQDDCDWSKEIQTSCGHKTIYAILLIKDKNPITYNPLSYKRVGKYLGDLRCV